MATTADIETALDRVADDLKRADRVLFITGAGISADSGLPTYRGIGGLYDGNTTEEGLRIEEALSGDVFALRPDITWKYLAQIEANCRHAGPNAAHYAIAELERRLPEVLVFTQNVDGLHRRAGSNKLIEVHGNLQQLMCTHCSFETAAENLAGWTIPPRCPDCGHVLRPEVVLFGESLPEEAMERFLDALGEGFDMIFSIGTSSTFPYISQPVLWATQVGIPTVEINPGQTVLSRLVDHRLPTGAAAAMGGLMQRLGQPSRAA